MTTQEAVEFWRNLGHGPDDGCDPESPSGARSSVWKEAHTNQEER
jgi:hypothetical protein